MSAAIGRRRGAPRPVWASVSLPAASLALLLLAGPLVAQAGRPGSAATPGRSDTVVAAHLVDPTARRLSLDEALDLADAGSETSASPGRTWTAPAATAAERGAAISPY